MTELPIKVTLKSGGNQADPWITVGAESPEQLVDRLNRMDEALSKAAEVAHRFATLHTVARDLGATHVETQYDAPPQAAQQAAQPAPQAPPQPQQAAPVPPPPFDGPPQGGGEVRVETDKWNNTYEHGRPDAPNTAFGPAVLKRGTARSGKPYARWIDPRDKGIPSVYASGQRDNPPDLWEGDWARV